MSKKTPPSTKPSAKVMGIPPSPARRIRPTAGKPKKPKK